MELQTAYGDLKIKIYLAESIFFKFIKISIYVRCVKNNWEIQDIFDEVNSLLSLFHLIKLLIIKQSLFGIYNHFLKVSFMRFKYTICVTII